MPLPRTAGGFDRSRLWPLARTVVGPADSLPTGTEEENSQSWRCRCACGADGIFAEKFLTSERTLSCGCRPDKEVRLKREWKRNRSVERFCKGGGAMETKRTGPGMDPHDGKRALCAFQPKCLLCGRSDDLTNQHVRPSIHGGELRPGNAVRLCRSCNSWIHDREVEELPPENGRRPPAGGRAVQRALGGRVRHSPGLPHRPGGGDAKGSRPRPRPCRAFVRRGTRRHRIPGPGRLAGRARRSTGCPSCGTWPDVFELRGLGMDVAMDRPVRGRIEYPQAVPWRSPNGHRHG